MPLYDYACRHCGPFSVRRSMAQAAQPAECPACSSSAPRVIAAPFLNVMNGNNRKAHQRNELNADSPSVMSRAELDLKIATSQPHHDRSPSHGPHCEHDHETSAPPGARRLTGSGDYRQSSKPWMIGH